MSRLGCRGYQMMVARGGQEVPSSGVGNVG